MQVLLSLQGCIRGSLMFLLDKKLINEQDKHQLISPETVVYQTYTNSRVKQRYTDTDHTLRHAYHTLIPASH